MLDSIPAPLLAILWPLVGAAVILILRRLLPNWMRRLLAALFVLASLLILRSLASEAGGIEQVEFLWQPLNLFRLSPVLRADGLTLLAGLTLAGVTAVLVLGIRGREPRRTAWHGLLLVALAGSLATTMAANLLTLALGSALLDLALLTLALLTAGETERGPWQMAVPGVASTLLLFLAALRMDAEVGTASLLARELPTGVLIWVGVAAVLRFLVFPLHPRCLNRPEDAATLMLPLGVGIYLLARVEALAPTLAVQPWPLVVAGAALLAGGLLAWSGSGGSARSAATPETAVRGLWPGVAVHQTGLVLAGVVLGAAPLPRSLPALLLALGLLAVWWDHTVEVSLGPRPRWVEWLLERLRGWLGRVRSALVARFPHLERWQAAWPVRRWPALLPAVALASLAGLPLMAGASGRRAAYAALIGGGRGWLLLLTLAADTLLVAGLWLTLVQTLKHVGERRFTIGALVALLLLAISLLVVGVSPDGLVSRLGLEPVELPDVSVWGIGLVCGLPWLLGFWLAHSGDRLARYLDGVQRVVNLDWLYRGLSWIGRRLASVVYWVSCVGEGEGWWGWVLIILALGAVLVMSR